MNISEAGENTPTKHFPNASNVTPFQAIAEAVSASGAELIQQVAALIDQAQALVSSQANAVLTLRN